MRTGDSGQVAYMVQLLIDAADVGLQHEQTEIQSPLGCLGLECLGVVVNGRPVFYALAVFARIVPDRFKRTLGVEVLDVLEVQRVVAFAFFAVAAAAAAAALQLDSGLFS